MNRHASHTGREPSLSNEEADSADEVQLGGENALLHIVENLDHESAKIRERAAFILAEKGHPAAFDALLCLMQEAPIRPPDRRSRAVNALSKLNDPRVFEVLQARLEDKEERKETRHAAFEGLMRLGDPRVNDLLLSFVQNKEDDYVCLRAIEGLVRLGDPRVNDLLLSLVQPQGSYALFSGAVEGLVKLGDPRLNDLLVSCIQHRYPSNLACHDAMRALGRLNDPRTVDVLKPLVLDPHEPMDDRLEAAWVLGELGVQDTDLLDALSEEMKSQNVEAARLLGCLHDRRAVPQLLERLAQIDVSDLACDDFDDDEEFPEPSDEELEVYTITSALGELGDPRAVQPLLDLLPAAWCIVAEPLGKLRDPRAIKPLLEALPLERNQGDRGGTQVIGALGQFDDSRIVDELMVEFQSPWQHRQSEVVSALSKMGSSLGVPALLHVLEHPQSHTRAKWGALSYLSRHYSLEPGVRDAVNRALEDPALCGKAAEILGEQRETHAVEALIRLLDSEDMHVQELVRQALLQIGTPRHLMRSKRSSTNAEVAARGRSIRCRGQSECAAKGYPVPQTRAAPGH